VPADPRVGCHPVRECLFTCGEGQPLTAAYSAEFDPEFGGEQTPEGEP
jgi:hypothetical protein